jgi:hypothetical protein
MTQPTEYVLHAELLVPRSSQGLPARVVALGLQNSCVMTIPPSVLNLIEADNWPIVGAMLQCPMCAAMHVDPSELAWWMAPIRDESDDDTAD